VWCPSPAHPIQIRHRTQVILAVVEVGCAAAAAIAAIAAKYACGQAQSARRQAAASERQTGLMQEQLLQVSKLEEIESTRRRREKALRLVHIMHTCARDAQRMISNWDLSDEDGLRDAEARYEQSSGQVVPALFDLASEGTTEDMDAASLRFKKAADQFVLVGAILHVTFTARANGDVDADPEHHKVQAGQCIGEMDEAGQDLLKCL
jgi:hypothetical protein